MGRQTGKVNIALAAAAVLLCLTLFTTHLTSGLYAKYTASAENSDSAKVARYVFDVKKGTTEEAFTIQLDSIRKPGDSDSCTFTITNADKNGVCEVAQQYTVEILELGSLPLTYSISDVNSDTSHMDPPSVNAEFDGSGTEMHTGTLKAGEEDSRTMTLDISWPAEKAELTYAGGVASLHIRIAAEQLD